MGDWVLYAAAIIGAWSMAEAVMRLVDALDKKKDRLSAGTEKRSCRSNSADREHYHCSRKSTNWQGGIWENGRKFRASGVLGGDPGRRAL